VASTVQAEQEEAERSPDGALNLSDDEEQKVKERTALPASVVHAAIRREGADELKRPSSALAWSGLAAGLSMGFSLVAEGLLRSHLPDAPWRPLVAKLGYSLGYLIVILGRQQLFTENTLTVILPLMIRRDLKTLLHVVRLWSIVLVANLLGALIFAWAAGNTDAFTPEVRHAFSSMGHDAMEAPFWTILIRGIYGGWLVALLVWLLPLAESARVLVIILLTYIVGLGGFSHIIVGSLEVLYLVTTGGASWGDYFGSFMLPALIGNVIGGVSLVAALNHAQTISGGASED